MVLDTGMWAGMTLYPESKCTPARAIDILENYGAERIWMNSACDWGISIPLAVPRTALEMRKRGWTEERTDAVIFGNPLRFMSQNPRFRI
jgi:predicted metal-dependent TIM-barrel fold hydrolase